MSIKHCDKHGTWDPIVWTECPKCFMEAGWEKEEKTRKTFFGMTAVGWYLSLYIAIVLIAMAWIVLAGGT